MNSKVDNQDIRSDTYKLASSGALVLVAVLLFYVFSDVSTLLRTVLLLAALGGAVGLSISTQLGSNVVSFLKDSRMELRKVVWPTRQETTQTTLAVLAMVVIMGLFLWLLDTILVWIVKLLIG